MFTAGNHEIDAPIESNLAGDRRVQLPEAVRPRPRKVRVAEQQAGAGGGGFAAECDGVAREAAAALLRVAPGPAFGPGRVGLHRGRHLPGGQARRAQRRGAGGAREGRRRLRGVDRLDEVRAAAGEGVAAHRADQVEGLERAHPRRAAAGFGQAGAAAFGEPAVHAAHVAGDEVLHLLPLPLPRGRDGGLVVDPGVEEVAREVVDEAAAAVAVVSGFGPEVAAALALHGDGVLREQAEVVLRERVAHAVAQALLVARQHVRHAEGGAPHEGRELRCRGQRPQLGRRRGAGCGGGGQGAAQRGGGQCRDGGAPPRGDRVAKGRGHRSSPRSGVWLAAGGQYTSRSGRTSRRIVVAISSIDLCVEDSHWMPSRRIIASASFTS
jgi:hypothetical protein